MEETKTQTNDISGRNASLVDRLNGSEAGLIAHEVMKIMDRSDAETVYLSKFYENMQKANSIEDLNEAWYDFSKSTSLNDIRDEKKYQLVEDIYSKLQTFCPGITASDSRGIFTLLKHEPIRFKKAIIKIRESARRTKFSAGAAPKRGIRDGRAETNFYQKGIENAVDAVKSYNVEADGQKLGENKECNPNQKYLDSYIDASVASHLTYHTKHYLASRREFLYNAFMAIESYESSVDSKKEKRTADSFKSYASKSFNELSKHYAKITKTFFDLMEKIPATEEEFYKTPIDVFLKMGYKERYCDLITRHDNFKNIKNILEQISECSTYGGSGLEILADKAKNDGESYSFYLNEKVRKEA